MLWLFDSIEAIRDFMELGGPVLRWIALTIFLMWVLIVERLMYFRSTMKSMAEDIRNNWENRNERRSWHAHQIREMMISRFSMATNKGISMIQTLVALCPLLGLLGTVVGMIDVFTQITTVGTGNANALAGGISEALLTTAAGLIVAIPALVMHRYYTGLIDTIVVDLEREAIKLVDAIHNGAGQDYTT